MAAAVTQAQVDLTTLNERRPKERTPEPTVVVIFGASGDLTKRKLLPALFHLEQGACCRRNLPWWAWRGGRWATALRKICARASRSLAA